MYDTLQRLCAYVDALRPLIYIHHFDARAVDALLKQAVGDAEIYEYQDADGWVDFETKVPKMRYDLKAFLSAFDHQDGQPTFLVLKDAHHHLHDPEILARLKSIALKTLYHEHFQVTIFLVSSRLVIPNEIEKFITVFDIPLPGLADITEIIRAFRPAPDFTIDAQIVEELALSFKGLSEFEITQILNLAYQSDGVIDRHDASLILQEKEQAIKKQGMLEILNFKETIDDIGGLEKLKEWLRKKAKIFQQLDQALKFGVDVPKGIMLIGMPGCGKSLAAKATAHLFGAPLLRLDVGQLLGKYVGESEENLRRAIKIAEAVSPCVLWVDEIEKAFAGIGEQGGGSDVTTRLFGHFLTWIQEKESTVFIVATSNDIAKLPAEFLRKGRFDELFFVDFPNAAERRNIFEIHLKKRRKWNRGIDSIKLVKETKGYSGADIEAVVKETIENAFIDGKDAITTDNLLAVIATTKPLSKTLAEKVQKVREDLKKIDIKQASEGAASE